MDGRIIDFVKAQKKQEESLNTRRRMKVTGGPEKIEDEEEEFLSERQKRKENERIKFIISMIKNMDRGYGISRDILQEEFNRINNYKAQKKTLTCIADDIVTDSDGNEVDAEPEIDRTRYILWSDIILESDLGKACVKMNRNKHSYFVKVDDKSVWSIVRL